MVDQPFIPHVSPFLSVRKTLVLYVNIRFCVFLFFSNVKQSATISQILVQKEFYVHGFFFLNVLTYFLLRLIVLLFDRQHLQFASEELMKHKKDRLYSLIGLTTTLSSDDKNSNSGGNFNSNSNNSNTANSDGRAK